MAPGAYLVLCQDLLRFRRIHPAVTNSLGGFAFGLKKAKDSIRLGDPTGAPVLQLDNETDPPWPIEADGAGHTVQLRNPRAYSPQPAAWKKSPTSKVSPGRGNPN